MSCLGQHLRVAASILGLLPLVGCTVWQRTSGNPLPQLAPAVESVGLDVVTARLPISELAAESELWQQIDEQQLPVELRRLLTANGFRAGVIESRLPAKLEKLLKLTAEPAPNTAVNQVTDFENEPPVRHRVVQVMAGRRTNIILTGEATRHAELPVLVKAPDGVVHGRTYRQVMGLMAARAFPEGDGRVRLELAPELEHGDSQRRYEPVDGIIKVEFGPPHEKFEYLRTVVTLSPGQMLLVTGLAERPGSLGHQFFIDGAGDKTHQKLLLIRVAQTRYDELFTPDTLLDAPAVQMEAKAESGKRKTESQTPKSSVPKVQVDEIPDAPR